MNLKIIGERILYFRKQEKLTQEQLAKRAKVTVQTICRIETGENYGNIETLVRIADALGVHVEQLFRDHTQRSLYQSKKAYEQAVKLVGKLPPHKVEALILLLQN
jgi:transcriptional regulator with XRE-family HTH domain